VRRAARPIIAERLAADDVQLDDHFAAHVVGQPLHQPAQRPNASDPRSATHHQGCTTGPAEVSHSSCSAVRGSCGCGSTDVIDSTRPFHFSRFAALTSSRLRRLTRYCG
jgi:hypothetical protein